MAEPFFSVRNRTQFSKKPINLFVIVLSLWGNWKTVQWHGSCAVWTAQKELRVIVDNLGGVFSGFFIL